MSEEHTREEDEVTTNPERKQGKGGLFFIIALLLAVGIGYFYMSKGGDKAVATVDGEKITEAEYQSLVNEFERGWQMNFEQGGQSVPASDSQAQAVIKNEALESLINDKLILAAAKKAGISVKDEEVDEIINEYKNAPSELGTFSEQLKEAGITEKQFRNRIKTQLTARAYAEQNVPAEVLEVSDEEIQALYDANKEALGEMTFEDFKAGVKEELEMSKLNDAFVSILGELRAQADVKILIDLPEIETPNMTPDLPIIEEGELPELEEETPVTEEEEATEEEEITEE